MSKHKKVIGFELDPELNEELTAIAKNFGMTRLAVVERGIEAVADLLDRHERVAEKAAEADIGELFMKVAKEMPAGLDAAKVEAARFRDGRPALVLDNEWVIAPDRNDELMVARKDGGEVGRIHRGRPEMLAVTDVEIARIAALN